MCNLYSFLLASTIMLATIIVVSASSLLVRPSLQERNVVPAQYDVNLCGNWHRQCARLYGEGTPNWYACMNQPQARYDCGGSAGYGGGGGYARGGYQQDIDTCGNWRQQCARL